MDEAVQLHPEAGERVRPDVSAYGRKRDIEAVRAMRTEPDEEIFEFRHRGGNYEAREMRWGATEVESSQLFEFVREDELR